MSCPPLRSSGYHQIFGCPTVAPLLYLLPLRGQLSASTSLTYSAWGLLDSHTGFPINYSMKHYFLLKQKPQRKLLRLLFQKEVEKKEGIINNWILNHTHMCYRPSPYIPSISPLFDHVEDKSELRDATSNFLPQFTTSSVFLVKRQVPHRNPFATAGLLTCNFHPTFR